MTLRTWFASLLISVAALGAVSLVPAVASAQSYYGGSGQLVVYVNVTNNGTTNTNGLCSNGTYNCYNTTSSNCYYNSIYPYTSNNCQNYLPSNFTVTVSGNDPSPATFQGSSSGTYVVLGSGQYQAYANTPTGWTVSQSGNCSGYMSSGQSLSCTLTFSNSNSYPYNYNSPLTCAPAYQQVAVDASASFTAIGGVGAYSWATSNQTYPSIGSTFNTTFLSPGVQTVVVSSDGQSASCTVDVTGAGYVTPYSYQYPTPTVVAYVAPSLPNTGYDPNGALELAFAILAILAFGYTLYPYVRNALVQLFG